jgi:hypothetical protein
MICTDTAIGIEQLKFVALTPFTSYDYACDVKECAERWQNYKDALKFIDQIKFDLFLAKTVSKMQSLGASASEIEGARAYYTTLFNQNLQNLEGSEPPAHLWWLFKPTEWTRTVNHIFYTKLCLISLAARIVAHFTTELSTRRVFCVDVLDKISDAFFYYCQRYPSLASSKALFPMWALSFKLFKDTIVPFNLTAWSIIQSARQGIDIYDIATCNLAIFTVFRRGLAEAVKGWFGSKVPRPITIGMFALIPYSLPASLEDPSLTYPKMPARYHSNEPFCRYICKLQPLPVTRGLFILSNNIPYLFEKASLVAYIFEIRISGIAWINPATQTTFAEKDLYVDPVFDEFLKSSLLRIEREENQQLLRSS